MKKFTTTLFTAFVVLCSNVFAVNIGDTASYKLSSNKDRTSSLVKKATGALTVVPLPRGKSCEAGTVIKLEYELEVMLKGKQKGDIGICVPPNMVGTTFYDNLAEYGQQSFGSFALEHAGRTSATDANGKDYDTCHAIEGSKIDHNYKRGDELNHAEVLWFNHEGKIKAVRNLEVAYKASRGVPVLGAVEIDIRGISDAGINFRVGLDLK